MSKKKYTNSIIITAIICLLVGCLLGLIVNISSSRIECLKRNKEQRKPIFTSTDKDNIAVQENLRNDVGYCEQTLSSLIYMHSRVGEYKVNSKLAFEVTSTIPEMKNISIQIKDYSLFAENVENKLYHTILELNRIVAGDNSNYYSEICDEAVLAYALLSRGYDVGIQFVKLADEVIENGVDDNLQLSFVRDQWVSFFVMEALVNERYADLQFWNDIGLSLTGELSRRVFSSLPQTTRTEIVYSSIVNDEVLSNRYYSPNSKLERSVNVNENDVNLKNQSLILISSIDRLGIQRSHDILIKNDKIRIIRDNPKLNFDIHNSYRPFDEITIESAAALNMILM